jgi:hypothetical protein
MRDLKFDDAAEHGQPLAILVTAEGGSHRGQVSRGGDKGPEPMAKVLARRRTAKINVSVWYAGRRGDHLQFARRRCDRNSGSGRQCLLVKCCRLSGTAASTKLVDGCGQLLKVPFRERRADVQARGDDVCAPQDLR